jgi:6-phosphogluconolactonase
VGAVDTSIRVLDDLDAVADEVARAFARASRDAVRERRRFRVALSGGHTPEPVYRALGSSLREEVPWESVHVFWSDERFVPADDENSNYRMARETLLSPASVPESNVHRPATEGFSPEESARRYEARIRDLFAEPMPRFDWILLGIGEDGHVASLFPGSPVLREKKRLVAAVHNAPKPPPVRLTMTLPLLNAGREVHVLASGREKRAILERVLGGGSRRTLPAQRVRPLQGTLHWWLDRAAAGDTGDR